MVCVHHVPAGYPFPEHQKLSRPQLGVDLSTSGRAADGNRARKASWEGRGDQAPMCANAALGDMGK